MILTMAVVVGVLFGSGTYLVLQRTLTRIVLGLGLWGYGVNVLLRAAGGPAGAPPFVGPEARGPMADPLPQAMALTAIVITFSVAAFLLALAYRSWTLTGDDEAEDDIEDRRIAALQRYPEDAAPEEWE
jgi:multicomponent Na+:H+ antiporter subunit C